MKDAGGTQTVVATVTAAGLEPVTRLVVYAEARLLAVTYGPTMTYVEDRAAVHSFTTAWHLARHRAIAVGLPTYAAGLRRADPSLGACLLLRAAGDCQTDVVAMARGVAPDGVPSVRVRVGRLVVRAYDLAAVLQIGALWEQAAGLARALPPIARPEAARPARRART